MASFVTVADGTDDVLAEHINQVVQALQGLRNIPFTHTVNDSSAYRFTGKNTGTGSKDTIIYAADGTTVLFQVDGNGVKVSTAGGAAVAPATQAGTETLTNKTLTTPTLSSPVINGAVSGTAGFGASTAFTPALQQSNIMALSSAVGRYIQIGKLVHAWVSIVANGAGTGGVAIAVTGLPVGHAGWNNAFCFGYFSRAGNPNHVLIGKQFSSTGVNFFSGAAATGLFGVNPAITIAAGDAIDLTYVYEAA